MLGKSFFRLALLGCLAMASTAAVEQESRLKECEAKCPRSYEPIYIVVINPKGEKECRVIENPCVYECMQFDEKTTERVEKCDPKCEIRKCDREPCDPIYINGEKQCYKFPNSCEYKNQICRGGEIPKEFQIDCSENCSNMWAWRCNPYWLDPVYVVIINANGEKECKMYANGCMFGQAKCRELACSTYYVVDHCEPDCKEEDCSAYPKNPISVQLAQPDGTYRCFNLTNECYYNNWLCTGVIPKEFEYDCSNCRQYPCIPIYIEYYDETGRLVCKEFCNKCELEQAIKNGEFPSKYWQVEQCTKNCTKECPDCKDPVIVRYINNKGVLVCEEIINYCTYKKLKCEGKLPGDATIVDSWDECRQIDDCPSIKPVYIAVFDGRQWVCKEIRNECEYKRIYETLPEHNVINEEECKKLMA